MKIGKQLSDTNSYLVDLILNESNAKKQKKLRKQLTRCSILTGQLIHGNINEASEEYVSATKALKKANKLLKEAITEIRKVAKAIKKIAKAIDLLAQLAAAAA